MTNLRHIFCTHRRGWWRWSLLWMRLFVLYIACHGSGLGFSLLLHLLPATSQLKLFDCVLFARLPLYYTSQEPVCQLALRPWGEQSLFWLGLPAFMVYGINLNLLRWACGLIVLITFKRRKEWRGFVFLSKTSKRSRDHLKAKSSLWRANTL